MMQLQMGAPRLGLGQPIFGAFQLKPLALHDPNSKWKAPRETRMRWSESADQQGFNFTVAAAPTKPEDVFFEMPGFKNRKTFYLTLSAPKKAKHQKLLAEISYLRKEKVGELERYRPGRDPRFVTEDILYDRVIKSTITLDAGKDIPLLRQLTKLVGKLPLPAEAQQGLQKHLAQVKTALQKPGVSASPQATWHETLDFDRDTLLQYARETYISHQKAEAQEEDPSRNTKILAMLFQRAERAQRAGVFTEPISPWRDFWPSGT